MACELMAVMEVLTISNFFPGKRSRNRHLQITSCAVGGLRVAHRGRFAKDENARSVRRFLGRHHQRARPTGEFGRKKSQRERVVVSEELLPTHAQLAEETRRRNRSAPTRNASSTRPSSSTAAAGPRAGRATNARRERGRDAAGAGARFGFCRAAVSRSKKVGKKHSNIQHRKPNIQLAR
jgi:hypothetical protein